MRLAKPSFRAAWAASLKIYDPADPAGKVAQVIGGSIAANIHDKRNPWKNTCAVRISYILNQSGVLLPAIAKQTRKGADGRNYFFRVKEVIAFLKHEWGPPEVIPYPPPGGGILAGRKGLILFEVHGWADAAGHATLFNGINCYDHCYFNETGAKYRTSKANFWALK